MVAQNSEKPFEPHPTAVWLYNTLEWLIMAVSVTLVFIVFEMQAYTIPTSSMADTLHGAHFRIRCSQCGYLYTYGFEPQFYGYHRNTKPGSNVSIRPEKPRCPSCGFYLQTTEPMPVLSGDRIFVAKCIYQFFKPKRWDVVVFKSPVNPNENYIKRMIGLSGETIELIDGDVYVNGQIQRKPMGVQEELWMPIYDNDYQPANPDIDRFNGHVWREPFYNLDDSKWDLSSNNSTRFLLNSEDGQIHTIRYDTDMGNDFKASYAHDKPSGYYYMPICSDLMIKFYVKNKNCNGIIGAELSKYGIQYRGRIDFEIGRMYIERIEEGGETAILNEGAFTKIEYPIHFRFINVDHNLILELGKNKIEFFLGPDKDDAGIRHTNIMPNAKIFGSGMLELTHIGIFRDIHYLSKNKGQPVLQGGQSNPITLEDGQYFVCGDNSPVSGDSRLWNIPGKGNNGKKYRQGTVPQEYLVGKAFFVYWPGALKPLNGSKIAEILEKNRTLRILKLALNSPDVNGIKIIKGGKR